MKEVKKALNPLFYMRLGGFWLGYTLCPKLFISIDEIFELAVYDLQG